LKKRNKKIISHRELSFTLKNKNIYLNLVFTVGFFILATILSSLFEYHQNNYDRIINSVQHTINKNENEIKERIEYISDIYPFLDDMDSRTINNDEIFIYDNDTLIYWSSNIVPVPDIYDRHLFSNSILELENGWYCIRKTIKGETSFIGTFLIKANYSYQNDYLENSFHSGLKVDPDVSVSLKESEYNIYDTKGDFLFSLEFPDKRNYTSLQIIVLLLLFSLGLVFLIKLIYRAYESFPFFRRYKLLLLAGFLIDVVIVRTAIFYFKLPLSLNDTLLFSPYHYAASDLCPSLGDLLINMVMILCVSYIYFSKFEISGKIKNDYLKFTSLVIIFSVVFIFYIVFIRFIARFVLHSGISFNLLNINTLDGYSLVGFLILAAAALSFFFLSSKLCKQAWFLAGKTFDYFIAIAITAVLSSVYIILIKDFDPVYYLLLLILIVSFHYVHSRKKGEISFSIIIFFLLLFAVISNYTLNKFNNEKERDYRRLLATELSYERDPITEFEFSSMEKRIVKDKYIQEILRKEDYSDREQRLISYIENNYLNSFRNKYDIQVTICNPQEVLNVKPDNYLVECDLYFADIIDAVGVETMCRYLYYLDDNSENNNYLAAVPVLIDSTGNGGGFSLYIEMYSKLIPEEGLGYPELLIDKEVNITSNLFDYSYARYRDGKLTYRYGDYFYSIDLLPYEQNIEDEFFFERNGFNHYYNKVKDDNVMIISHRERVFLDRIAPFSYLFLFYGIFALLFFLILILPTKKTSLQINFRDRLEASIIAIILLAFLVLGLLTRVYILQHNNEKNIDILTEKTHSVLIELEHKMAGVQDWTPELQDYMNELLYKFSQVFFSDINIYNLNGDLVASSRPQIFQEGLLSTKMNAIAFYKLREEQKLQYIHTESIGNMDYLSSYLPFRNNRDEIISYLNLPYFSKQKEIRNEISNFLIAYINIYILLIALAIFITVLVSRYVTKPLKMIREKLGQIKLGNLDEKIYWQREDEIGGLINEYNRMLEELAQNAEILARSERETAWREMAKQVAHEIKNPLTPMKLSVQHLKKAWDDNSPEWEEKLKRFTETIVEQIDTLSDIASEFSDFAKMPRSRIEEIELPSVVKNAIDLFGDIPNIIITYYYDEDVDFTIRADRNQMLRVFNNLIKNSIQAIGKKTNGRIEITIEKHGEHCIVEVKDNGKGIPKDQAIKIFSPSFTTKSGGMGLGLSIVKSIIDGIGGEIIFESSPGIGTLFIIKLPLIV